jgi:hypothetical protein
MLFPFVWKSSLSILANIDGGGKRSVIDRRISSNDENGNNDLELYLSFPDQEIQAFLSISEFWNIVPKLLLS